MSELIQRINRALVAFIQKISLDALIFCRRDGEGEQGFFSQRMPACYLSDFVILHFESGCHLSLSLETYGCLVTVHNLRPMQGLSVPKVADLCDVFFSMLFPCFVGNEQASFTNVWCDSGLPT